jgi:cell division protein 48 (CDC48)-like
MKDEYRTAATQGKNSVEGSLQGRQKEKPLITAQHTKEYHEHYNYERDIKLGFPRRHDNGKNLAAVDDVFTHRLKVKEAHKEDVGRHIVRIDRSSLILMGLRVKDIVIITGKSGRKTAAKCLDSMLLEIEPVIRMDRLMRYNLGMRIDDIVDSRSIAKADNGIGIYNQCDNNNYEGEVVLEPLAAGIPASIDEQYVARALEGAPVIKGQAILIPYYGGLWFPYVILDLRKTKGTDIEKLEDQAAIVGPDTVIIFDSIENKSEHN